jgi:hypothetical protein
VVRVAGGEVVVVSVVLEPPPLLHAVRPITANSTAKKTPCRTLEPTVVLIVVLIFLSKKIPPLAILNYSKDAPSAALIA